MVWRRAVRAAARVCDEAGVVVIFGCLYALVLVMWTMFWGGSAVSVVVATRVKCVGIKDFGTTVESGVRRVLGNRDGLLLDDERAVIL